MSEEIKIDRQKLIYASAFSAALTMVVITAITIYAEFSAPFKDSLKNWSGHHWTSKSLLTVIIYALVLGMVYSSARRPSGSLLRKSLYFTIAALTICYFTLLLFFTYHHFSA